MNNKKEVMSPVEKLHSKITRQLIKYVEESFGVSIGYADTFLVDIGCYIDLDDDLDRAVWSEKLEKLFKHYHAEYDDSVADLAFSLIALDIILQQK